MTAETLRKLAAAGFITVFATFGMAACEDTAEDPAMEEEEDPGLEEEEAPAEEEEEG